MIKLCIFDMDGLLLDSERFLYLYTGMNVSKELGYPMEEDFLRSLMGLSWDKYRETIIQKMGRDFPIEDYLKGLWQRIDYLIENESIPLRKGALNILEYCKNNDITIALASSTHYEKVINCLKNAGIMEYFDYIVTGDMVKNGKPDPEIYRKVIDHYSYPIESIMALEDAHNGALSAVGAGCRLVLIEDLAYVDDEDRKAAELLPESLDEVIDYIRKENETTAGI